MNRPDEKSEAPAGPWLRRWWALMELRVGLVPVPVLVLIAAITTYLVALGKLPAEACAMIAVIGAGGFVCAEIGKRLPLLRHIGGSAIVAAFLPAALVYYHVMPSALAKPITDFTKSTNFLYLFITAIIVGSILSMDRRLLVRGFLKIFVPLAAGSVIALGVGTLVGAILGLGARHTLLFVVIPIMAGGMGEGAIPLSTGYAEIFHQSQGDFFAQVLPPVMLGNLTAVLFAGILNNLGKRFPKLSGNGHLQPDGPDEAPLPEEEKDPRIDVGQIATAGIFAVSLYLVGIVVKEAWGFPAPVAMLFLAVAVKLLRAAPDGLQAGTGVVYRFFRSAVTYPLLFAVSVAMTPWDKLVAALAVPNLITIVATVGALTTTGFFVGRWMKLYPIETAIINACHSGMGGTGDIAILTASQRMVLMPFAQIATRIAGAITVTLTLLALAHRS